MGDFDMDDYKEAMERADMAMDDAVAEARRQVWEEAAELAEAKAGAESDEHTAKELRALAGDYRLLAEGK